MNERILFSALSRRTARLANGSKLPDMDFAQVLAGRSRALNSANPENTPAENLDISTLSITLQTHRNQLYNSDLLNAAILLHSDGMRDTGCVRMPPERFLSSPVNT